MKYACWYGNSIMEKSSLEEYEKNESKEKIVTHIIYKNNYMNTGRNVAHIWLKTYGLKSFEITCYLDETNLNDLKIKLNLIEDINFYEMQT